MMRPGKNFDFLRRTPPGRGADLSGLPVAAPVSENKLIGFSD